MEQLIALVNNDDVIVGYEEKQLVHSKGLLHRAFSIMVINSKREILLQRRALEKYHSSGLWTNTCCSHLPKGNSIELYAHQRLVEEMGFDCALKFIEKFHYRVAFDNDLIENEIDYIFIGEFEGNPTPDPSEVCEWKWIGIDAVKDDIQVNPNLYTYWFRFIVENHLDSILSKI